MNKMVDDSAKETIEFLFKNLHNLTHRDIEVEIETLKLTAYNMGRFDQKMETLEFNAKFNEILDKSTVYESNN